MEGEAARIPPLHRQPPSVDFIDNDLPTYHEAFRNIPAQYDYSKEQYVPILSLSAMPAAAAGSEAAESTLPPPRPMVPAKVPMAFWARIFEPAKNMLIARPEPKKVSGSTCSIRRETNWEGIYKQLQEAREIYDGTKIGFWGACKRGFRRITDQTDVARQVTKLVPDIEVVSPVLAALEVLLDVSWLLPSCMARSIDNNPGL